MKVAFRADAGTAIGTGHVMRCLTLARALAGQGADCVFVSRDLPGHLHDRIAAEFPLRALPAPPPGFAPAPQDPPHAAWAGVDWRRDAAETVAALGRVDWLVVDHYGFDARWEGAAAASAGHLLVLDDLANRPHAGDLLLDQSLGRHAGDYAPLVGPGTRLLLGPAHALLRPEFAAARDASLRRRTGAALRHLLVAMGGMDADNTISAILQAVAALPQAPELQVSVAISGQAPHLDALRGLAPGLPYPLRLCVDQADMAGLMTAADVAVSASGLTAYELACLGVPMLLLPVSPIQAKVAGHLAEVALARPVAGWQADPVARIGAALGAFLQDLADPGIPRPPGQAFDGKGVARVIAAMERVGCGPKEGPA